MKTLNQERFFQVVSAAGMTQPEMETVFGKILSYQLTNSQANRVIQLTEYITQGVNHSQFSWNLVSRILEIFISQTAGMNKDEIKSLYRSFTTIPKFNTVDGVSARPKNYKKLNSECTIRDYWGKPHALNDMLEVKGCPNLKDNYLKLMVRIRRDLNRAKKAKA